MTNSASARGSTAGSCTVHHPVAAEELTVIPGAEEVLALLELRLRARSGEWDVIVVDCAPTAETLPAERDWIRSLHHALRPHMIGAGSYVNAVEGADAGEVEATYGPKYQRLVSVKAKYDPDTVFHRNVNIAAPRIPSPRG